MVAQVSNSRPKNLLQSLDYLLQYFTPEQLTPIGNKKNAYLPEWQNGGLTKEALEKEIRSGKAWGIGLITGTPFIVNGERYYLMALDQDGASAEGKIHELLEGEELPPTVAFTSGKPGRVQRLYLIPEEFADSLHYKSFPTGVTGDDGKPEQVELRWKRQQSCKPGSYHPQTGEYFYLPGCSPSEVEIAIAPRRIVELMLPESEPIHTYHSYHSPSPHTRWTDSDYARSYLNALCPSRADSYETWIAVGMALHSVGDDSLFEEWDNWSRQSSKYRPKDCVTKWRSFKRTNGVSLGTLAFYAKQDGWQSPFKSQGSSYSSRPTGKAPAPKTATSSAIAGTTAQSTTAIADLSLEQAAEEARKILGQSLPELTANIKLEELRRACGMSDYNWEHKILRPLRRDSKIDRYKLDLKAALQIEDPIEQLLQASEIASKYSIRASDVQKSMLMMRDRISTPEVQVLDLEELFNLEIEALSWLAPGILPKGETIVLAGSPKAGKTLLAIDLAYAVATGEAGFLGENVARGKVLLVSTDESVSSTRAKLVNRGFRACDKDWIKVVPAWDITQMVKLEQILEDFKPDLTIIDSLRRINKGSEVSENSAEFADNIYTLKETLTRYGSAGVLIHHTNKDREALGVHRLRGSSAIAGATWGVWQIDHIPKPDPNNKKRQIIDPKDPRRVLSVFARDAEGLQVNIELNLEDSSWKNLGSGEEEEQQQLTIRDRILHVLDKNQHVPGLSGREIVELIGGDVNSHSIYNELGSMERKRLINSKVAPGDKRYRIYSLPRNKKESTTSVPPKITGNSLHPLPPPPSVQNMTNFSETVTQYGFEDSHIDSHVIVMSQTGTLPPELAEPLAVQETQNSHIDSSGTGGGGVECVVHSPQPAEVLHPIADHPNPAPEPEPEPEPDPAVDELNTPLEDMMNAIADINAQPDLTEEYFWGKASAFTASPELRSDFENALYLIDLLPRKHQVLRWWNEGWHRY